MLKDRVMLSNQIIRDFALNVQRISNMSDIDQQMGLKWMEKFQESEEAWSACYQIIKNPPDHVTMYYSILVLKNKIKRAAPRFTTDDIAKIYNFFIDFLRTYPSSQITTEICLIFVDLFTKPDSWIFPISRVVNDIMSINSGTSKSASYTNDDVFYFKTAAIFTHEFTLTLRTHNDMKFKRVRKNLRDDLNNLNALILYLIRAFENDPYHLKKIIDAYGRFCKISGQQDIESPSFLAIWNILRVHGYHDPDLLFSCTECISSCLKRFEPSNPNQIENGYNFFLRNLSDLKNIVFTAINVQSIKNLISLLDVSVTLSCTFFDIYIKSHYETEGYAFLDLVVPFFVIDKIEIYDKILMFWMKYSKYFYLIANEKFRRFSDLYLDSFIKYMFNAAMFSHPLIVQENPDDNNDEFVEYFRKDVLICLKHIFKHISCKPYYKIVADSLLSLSNDYSKAEAIIFFINTMIVDNPNFRNDFGEALLFISKLPLDAPLLLLRTSCQFLQDFVDTFKRRIPNKQILNLPSIFLYRSLIRVPKYASSALLSFSYYKIGKCKDTEVCFEYMDNIILNLTELSEIDNLSKLFGYKFYNSSIPTKIDVFKKICEAHTNAIYQEIEEKKDRLDTCKFTSFSTFATLIKNIHHYFKPPIEYWPTVEQIFAMCFNLIDQFREYERVISKICVLLRIIIMFTVGVCPIESIYVKILECFQVLKYACFIDLYYNIFKIYAREDQPPPWLTPQTYIWIRNSCLISGNLNLDEQPFFVEHLMKLVDSMLSFNRIETLSCLVLEQILEMASHGLLSDQKYTFIECNNVLYTLFSVSAIKPHENELYITINLYIRHVGKIIKCCLKTILSQRRKSFIKSCGVLLYHMGQFDKNYIIHQPNFLNTVILEECKSFPQQITQSGNIFNLIMGCVNASNEDEANDYDIY